MVNYESVTPFPPDPILSLTTRYNASTNPKKVNLGVGAYRDENGKPVVLASVAEAERRVFEHHFNHEYAPMQGLTDYRRLSQELIFGKASDEIATVSSLSGSGALFIGFSFLLNAFGPTPMHFPNPVWGNTTAIYNHAMRDGKAMSYDYLIPGTPHLAFDSMLKYFSELAPETWVLMHPVAHNPSGVDPTKEQWQAIAQVFLKHRLNVFFDCAYQGFASGDLDSDAYAIRHFREVGVPMMVSQSYAKNLGLYGERCGALHVVTGSAKEAETVLSVLKIMVRRTYSSGPLFGSRIVEEVLGDPKLRSQWNDVDLKEMAGRIQKMRKMLREQLEKIECPSPKGCDGWKHITDQIGMFSYTMIPKEACLRLIEEFDVYLLAGSGRISISGLNEGNVEYVAECFKKVLSGAK